MSGGEWLSSLPEAEALFPEASDCSLKPRQSESSDNLTRPLQAQEGPGHENAPWNRLEEKLLLPSEGNGSLVLCKELRVKQTDWRATLPALPVL